MSREGCSHGSYPVSIVTEARLGLDAIVLVNRVRQVEVRVRGEVLRAEYIHDGLSA